MDILGARKSIAVQFPIRCYQFRSIWGGKVGYLGNFRALISVWSKESGPVAELYFHDSENLPDNPDPQDQTKTKPYQIHYPMSTLEPILHELRLSRNPLYLVYDYPASECQWAVAAEGGEKQYGYRASKKENP